MEKQVQAVKKPKSILKNVKLISGSVSCGFPSPADDYIDTPLDLNERLITKPTATFFVYAKGDSMIGAGIYDGDLLIIDKSLDPKPGNIVVACLNGEFTLKRLSRIKGKLFLTPENTKYSAIEINEEMDFRVWGVAIHSIRKLL